MSESQLPLSARHACHYQAITTSPLSTSPTSIHSASDVQTHTNTTLSLRNNRHPSGDDTQHVGSTTKDRAITHTQSNRTQEAYNTNSWPTQAKWGRWSASLYLENTGSVARDHLANERTFLAWVRTSLSTISVGVGITQLFRLDRSIGENPTLLTGGKAIGLLFLLIGMLFLSFAFVRYFQSQASMTQGFFPASRGMIVVTTLSTLSSFTLLLIAVAQK